MQESQDSHYSFTPKQHKIKSMQFHISEEARKIISFNMSPFKQEGNQYQQQLTPITHKTDRRYKEALKQLDVEDLVNDSIEFLSRNTTSNVVCSHYLNTIQRSILFQLLPLLSDGLVVIVSYNYILLKEKLRRIQDLISWAAINPDIEKVQIDYILSNISSKEIKLLIIHPDMLSLVSLSSININLLVLDQANYYLQNLDIGRVNQDLYQLLSQSTPDYIHLLLPNIQEAFLINLQQQKLFNREYQIYRESINLNIQITTTKDDQYIKSLLVLLKSQRLFRKNGILVFCNTPHQVETVQIQLQSNGFKSSSIDVKKCETQRQQIYYEFASSTIDIMVLQSGFLLPEGLKNFAYLTIHLQLPNNIETFILDISEMNKEANSHIFLNDEQYFLQRNQLCSKFCQVENISVLLQEHIYSNDLIVHDDNDICYWLNNRWLNQNKQSQDHKIKKLFLNQLAIQLEINKPQLMMILQQLEIEKWIEIQIQIPIEINIQQLNSTNEQLIANLQTYGKRSGNKIGNKCQVEDLIKNMNITPIQLIGILKQSQSKFDISEEAQVIKVLHLPSQSELQAKIVDLYSMLKKINLVKINNLDTIYLMAKSGAFKSLDCMWKQLQLQNNSEKIHNQIYEYLNQQCYLDQHNHPDLPFSRLETQRDKSTFQQDLKGIIQYCNMSESDLNWMQKENLATKALIILQGLKMNKNQAKSLLQWGKYRTYNYIKIHQVIHEIVDQIHNNQLQSLNNSYIGIRKKLKL